MFLARSRNTFACLKSVKYYGYSSTPIQPRETRFDKYMKKDVTEFMQNPTPKRAATLISRHWDLREAFSIFDALPKTGENKPDAILCSILIAKCKSTNSAKQAFNVWERIMANKMQPTAAIIKALVEIAMNEKNVTFVKNIVQFLKQTVVPQVPIKTFNTMISTLRGDVTDSLSLLDVMKCHNCSPDAYTFSILLKDNLGLPTVQMLHELVKQENLHGDVVVCSSLIQQYIKHDCFQQSVAIYDHLLGKGVADDMVHASMLIGCAKQGASALELGKKVHKRIKKETIISMTAVTKMYAYCDSIEAAMKIYNGMSIEPDLQLRGILLKACTETRDHKNGHRIVQDMLQSETTLSRERVNAIVSFYVACSHTDDAIGFIKNIITNNSSLISNNIIVFLLKACGESGSLVSVLELEQVLQDSPVMNDVQVLNTLLDMYAKCTDFNSAIRIFEYMKTQFKKLDQVTWNIMISVYGMYGHGEDAVKLFFEGIDRYGLKPDSVTFISVLTACSHSLMCDKAWELFSSMKLYNVMPEQKHYGCVVDAFARAGDIERAERILLDSDAPDIISWMAILGACRLQGDISRAERVASIIKQMQPDDANVYVLMSNIYSEAGMSEKADAEWLEMKSRGIKKIPGQTRVILDDGIVTTIAREIPAEFKDLIVKEREEIYKELEETSTYIPQLSAVTDQVSDEEKKKILCEHSEKTALFLGLHKVKKGPIRMIKNLRVCKDCHEFNKAVSKLKKREIIMRDAKRLHHFIDGKCSCNDVW